MDLQRITGSEKPDEVFETIARLDHPDAEAVLALIGKHASDTMTANVARAKDAGVLRGDVESSDLVILIWGVAATADATRDVAPDAWRRHLAILLHGLRPGAAHPLPVPPLKSAQLRDAAV